MTEFWEGGKAGFPLETCGNDTIIGRNDRIQGRDDVNLGGNDRILGGRERLDSR